MTSGSSVVGVGGSVSGVRARGGGVGDVARLVVGEGSPLSPGGGGMFVGVGRIRRLGPIAARGGGVIRGGGWGAVSC